MFKEFRKFIVRGNVMDLAVGIIIGTAFTAIVNSLVSDILMPPLGILVGNVDFSRITIVLRQATETSEAVTMQIGMFINALLRFLILAFAVFVIVRVVNRIADRFERNEESPAEEPSEEEPAADDIEPPQAKRPTTGERLIGAITELTATLKEQRDRPDA